MCESNGNEIRIDLSCVPVRALSISTRHQLSQYLNGEQVITTEDGLSRDYRGCAQLMGFSYATVNHVLRTNDPFNSLLDIYGNRSDANVEKLVKMFEQIGRFDIIDDMTPHFLTDAKHYLSNKNSNQSLGILSRLSTDNSSLQSVNRNNSIQSNDQYICYDAYVCYADHDLDFVKQLSQFLEDLNGLRLFIRDRDLLLGDWAYESFAQLIESQCRRVLIILSPDFLDCHECEFQTAFATGLAIEQRNRKLIPIIYKKCDLPPIIKMLTKIDMTRGRDSPDWTWNRLVNSIRNTVIKPSIVFRQNGSSTSTQALPALPSVPSNSQIDSIQTINPSLITLPSVCPEPTAPSLSSSSLMTEIHELKDLENSSLLSQENNSNSKKTNRRKWIQSIKQKFKVHS